MKAASPLGTMSEASASSQAEEFTHFENVITNRLYIAQVAQGSATQTLGQA
jgi:hypothetical protein